MTVWGARASRPVRRRTGGTAALVAFALLAACGDDDQRARPTMTPTATPAAARTATASATTSAATATSTPTPVGTTPVTRTATASPSPTGGAVSLAIGGALGAAGETVDVAVTLVAGGAVAGIQNDIGFDPEIPIAARPNGRPDCAVNPAIDKPGTSFGFLPPSCQPGVDCTGVRALVLSLDNVELIPVGAVLYTCQVAIAATAEPGPYSLRCSGAAASDPDGNPLQTSCRDGGVQVEFFPIPTATSTAPAATPSPTPTARSGAEGAVAPLTAAGRWLVDDLGRVVLLHGVNMVAKSAPYHPAAFGFGADDAAFLAAEGFSAVRLGIDFRGLMPTPGVVEQDYVEHLAESVDALVAHGLFVLLDFHQDGFAPMFNGNGLPDWMAISDGLPNPPDAVFPLYYIQNPAMQRAFENFWADRAGPGGVGVQEYFVQGVEAIAARFADQPLVLGTELMNEPFPGAEWMACALEDDGCPDLEQERLVPFYQRGAAAARGVAPTQLVFVEPFVLFNFGRANTSLPGPDERLAFSVHSYALDVAGEEAVIARAVAAAERDARPLLLTEFGASIDPALLNRLTAQMERGLVPWMFWAYDESIIADLRQPAGPDNLRSPEAFAALVRPYPIATAGTPTALEFNPSTRRFHFAYDTAGPDGGSYPRGVVTVVSVPARQYPDGYAVEADGAEVTSAPNATLLTLGAVAGTAHVSIEIVPAS